VEDWPAVETPPPAAISDRDLLDTLISRWDLGAVSLRYVPEGAGSYHWQAAAAGQRYFVTVDDLDVKPWISAEREATLAGLAIAYETARSLQCDAGLPLAVGPRPARDHSILVRLSDQYAVTVFPFVEGIPGRWGDELRPDWRAALTGQLATLHRVTGPIADRVPRRPLELAERPMLLTALQALDRPWSDGPLGEPARRALADHAESVTGRLAELDSLAASLDQAPQQLVLTHGEPHPGNLIMTSDGLRLVDWDTVTRALPERDLWMLDDGSADAFAPYAEVTGRSVNETALRFYRLAWTLSDIAFYAAAFRSPHDRAELAGRQWAGFLELLGGATSAPCG
jgi:spectinomycin phosphotransferase